MHIAFLRIVALRPILADETDTVRVELQKIVASPLFQGSKRCHDFLQYIVTRTLEGKLDGLTERFLGAELFGRRIDYDTKSDSIVRVRANDVRRKLTEYYADQHSTPKVVITLGAGGYVPEFHWPHKEGFQPSLGSGSSVTLRGNPDTTESQVGGHHDGSFLQRPVRDNWPASPERQKFFS